MQITLLTDGSTRANELIELLDESGESYELNADNTRHDLPLLIVDNKTLNFTKAQRWIKKRVKENGSNFIYD